MDGLELRQWRQARAWTQEELARALGVGVRTVQKWEHSERIRLGSVVRLALRGLDDSRGETGSSDAWAGR